MNPAAHGLAVGRRQAFGRAFEDAAYRKQAETLRASK